MDWQEIPFLPHHRQIVERFLSACREDERIVAAVLYGSYAKGTADAHSDLDLGLVTTEDTYADVVAARQEFARTLDEPLLLEDFDLAGILFAIFRNGTEAEIYFSSESDLAARLDRPFVPLLDKKGILARDVSPHDKPEYAGAPEKLRRQIYWFWHDMGHFLTAMGRRQLWWAYGQLEVLRRYCVNLARLEQDIRDSEAGDEPYWKIDQAIPTGRLAPLTATFCPLERTAIVRAGAVVLEFYRALAIPLAREYKISYPGELDRRMSERLAKLIEE